MEVQQISVFLENESGRLAEVADVLARNGINIRTLSLADMAEFGILRLIVDDTDKARRVLKDGGFTVSKTEVIAVAVPDRPGGLRAILAALDGKGINVEYMYAFVQKSGENAIIIFRVDDIRSAVETLGKAGVKLLDGQQVHAP